MSDFRYPLPTASPFDDIEQYIPLLLTAVEAELNTSSVWPDGESETGEGYAEDLIAWIMEIKNNMTVPIGGIIPFAGTDVPDGWLICQGQSVSKITYPALWHLLGDTYGASGLSTFRLPDLSGRAIIGTGFGTGLTNRVLADKVGTENHTLSVSEMPPHNHTQTSHSHTVTDGGHSHGVTDGGHSHGVTDPGHNHTIPARNATADGTGLPRLANSSTSNANGSTSNATTGVTVNNATTGVSVNSATTGVTINNAQPTINNTGGGAAHNNMQPSLALNFIIRAQ